MDLKLPQGKSYIHSLCMLASILHLLINHLVADRNLCITLLLSTDLRTRCLVAQEDSLSRHCPVSRPTNPPHLPLRATRNNKTSLRLLLQSTFITGSHQRIRRRPRTLPRLLPRTSNSRIRRQENGRINLHINLNLLLRRHPLIRNLQARAAVATDDLVATAAARLPATTRSAAIKEAATEVPILAPRCRIKKSQRAATDHLPGTGKTWPGRNEHVQLAFFPPNSA